MGVEAVLCAVVRASLSVVCVGVGFVFGMAGVRVGFGVGAGAGVVWVRPVGIIGVSVGSDGSVMVGVEVVLSNRVSMGVGFVTGPVVRTVATIIRIGAVSVTGVVGVCVGFGVGVAIGVVGVGVAVGVVGVGAGFGVNVVVGVAFVSSNCGHAGIGLSVYPVVKAVALVEGVGVCPDVVVVGIGVWCCVGVVTCVAGVGTVGVVGAGIESGVGVALWSSWLIACS